MLADLRIQKYCTISGGIFLLATALSIFQLYQAITVEFAATYFRPIHLSWILILAFLHYPLIPADTDNRAHPAQYKKRVYWAFRLIDILACALALFAAIRLMQFDYAGIDHLLYGLSGPDYIAGIAILVLTLEATRRSVGPEMALIGLVFMLYVLFGNLLPDAIANRGFTLERAVRFQVFTTEGVYGAPLGIAATAVFMFVLFGAFLETTGVGKFLIDLSYAAAGKYRGGPAKACVLASAGMGSISGSAIANAVAVGALTIPTMKKLGYKPEQAAGIEASASTGGQIMPPIMGAGAFIMADLTNTPYREIVLISIAPALLYFTSVLLYVHLMACKLGIEGVPDRPKLRAIFSEGWHFLLPLGIIVALLMLNFSPTLVGAIGCGAAAATCMLRKHSRISLSTLLQGLKSGAVMMIPISTACATAGIVVGAIGQTGLGLQFTEFVLSLSGGSLWLALLLVAAAAMILGMGLPVTAAYIILAVMAAPALESMGVPLLAAHLAIFWLSQTSNVTPPVALAAFAAAGVAGGHPQKSAIEALKLSSGFFIVPLLMVYSSLLWLEGVSSSAFMLSVFASIALIISLAFVIERYALTRLSRLEMLLFALVVPLVMWGTNIAQIGALALCALALIIHYKRMKPEQTERVHS